MKVIWPTVLSVDIKTPNLGLFSESPIAQQFQYNHPNCSERTKPWRSTLPLSCILLALVAFCAIFFHKITNKATFSLFPIYFPPLTFKASFTWQDRLQLTLLSREALKPFCFKCTSPTHGVILMFVKVCSKLKYVVSELLATLTQHALVWKEISL